MNPIIVNETKEFVLYGFSKTHDSNRSYGEDIIELLDKVWSAIANKGLSHTGINHVVYDVNHLMFAGIELVSPHEEADQLLERKEVVLQQYAYAKHIGPYSKLEETYKEVRSLIEHSGGHESMPLIEKYGHWNEDESKLETEIYHSFGTRKDG